MKSAIRNPQSAIRAEILVAALAVVAHLGALRVGFVYDDWAQILENPYLKHPQALRKIFGGNVWEFVGHAGISNFYRPMMQVWYWALYQAFGPHPGWFHLANLLLHAAVSVLAIALVARLSGNRMTGIIAGLFFAVYPLHTEVIAWVACAPELLCALFALAAMLAYVGAGPKSSPRRLQSPKPELGSRFKVQGSRSTWALVATGPLLLAALLSKEVAIAVPVLLLAWEFFSTSEPATPATERPSLRGSLPGANSVGGELWSAGLRAGGPSSSSPFTEGQITGQGGPPATLTGNPPGWRPALHMHASRYWNSSVTLSLCSRWPAWASMAAAIAAYFALRIHALGALMPVKQSIKLTAGEYVWTGFALFYRYIALAVWPFSLNFFRYLDLSHSLREPAVVAGVACSAAFAALFVGLVRSRRSQALAPLIYLLTLAPMFLLPYAGTGLLMTERAAYLPSVGICWLLALVVQSSKSKVQSRGRVLVPALVVLLLAAFTARSAVRMADWRDEVALFHEGLRSAPNAYHLHAFRAETLLRHDRPEEAAAAARQSLRLREDYADAHNLLGRSLWLLGRPEPALAEYVRTAALSVEQGRPDSAARAWNNAGILYRSAGRNDLAIAAYDRALALDPDSSGARNNLGFALLVVGRVDEAIEQLRLTLAKDPALSQAHANLGLALAMRGDLGAGWVELLEAERLSPADAEVQARLGELELARGNGAAGRTRLERALQLQPRNPRALAALERLRGGGQ